jgi:hypothetical protein
MPTYSPGGFTGTFIESDSTKYSSRSVDEYYMHLVQDELEDLLESYDSIYKKSNDRTKRMTLEKVKDLLKEKIEIINESM